MRCATGLRLQGARLGGRPICVVHSHARRIECAGGVLRTVRGEDHTASPHPSAGQGQREGDQQPHARHRPEEQPPRHRRKLIPILTWECWKHPEAAWSCGLRPARLTDAGQGNVSCLNSFEADPPYGLLLD
jgi:hypothetical protein